MIFQGMSEKEREETNSPVSTDLEIEIDFISSPEEFTDQLAQLVKGNNQPIGAKTVEHHTILDLWDFTGQHAYYASYPVFFSPRAIHLLVYDLSKGLKDIVQPCFKQGLKKIVQHNPNEETNLENLLSWLVSLSTRCSPKTKENVQKTKVGGRPYSCRPTVLIVGTHADKPHEDIEEMESQIKAEISGKDYDSYVIRPIFSVDNTKGLSNEGVAALQKRIMEVLKKQPHMGEEIPIR